MTLLDLYSGDKICITLYLGRKEKRKEFDMVQMYFDNGQWGDRVNSLGRGHEICAIGKLAEIDSMGIRLEDCELEE
jgi:hypothetical protein